MAPRGRGAAKAERLEGGHSGCPSHLAALRAAAVSPTASLAEIRWSWDGATGAVSPAATERWRAQLAELAMVGQSPSHRRAAKTHVSQHRRHDVQSHPKWMCCSRASRSRGARSRCRCQALQIYGTASLMLRCVPLTQFSLSLPSANVTCYVWTIGLDP